MEIAFESRKLRSLCEDNEGAERQLGPIVAEALRHRLADLRAAVSISDLVVGNPRLLDCGESAKLIIDLYDDVIITLKANHPENPVTEQGQQDWSQVIRIKVVHVGR